MPFVKDSDAAEIYKCLPDRCIRLLKFVPRTEDAGQLIHCNIFETSLDRHLEYQALSYVWGTFSQSVEILLNGRKFLVTENLAKALAHLEHQRHRTEYIWIDAICIDQKNLVERSQQVGMMSDVYSMAHNVCVWLRATTIYGVEGQSFSEVSGEIMRYVSSNVHQTDVCRPRGLGKILDYSTDFRNGQGYRNQDPSSPPSSKPHFSPNQSPGTSDWKEEIEPDQRLRGFIQAVICNEYWKRVWICQELALGRRTDFHMGGTELTWDDIAVIVKWCQNHSQCCLFNLTIPGVYASLRLLEMHLGLKEADIKTFSDASYALDFLHLGQKLEASDNMDRIYGLISLGKDEVYGGTRPDYSISATQLSMDFVLDFISRTKRLDILTFAVWTLEAKRSKKYDPPPSWALNWRNNADDAFWKLAVRNAVYSAGYPLPAQIILRAGRVLSVTGRKVASVTRVKHYPSLWASEELRRFCEDCKPWSVEDAGRLICRDVRLGPHWQRSFISFDLMLSQSQRATDEDQIGVWFHQKLHASTADEEHIDVNPALTRSALSRLHTRNRLLVLDSGRLAIGSLNVLEDDVICVFAGSSAPFVSREVQHKIYSSESCYKLVGHAYVPGAMDGEAFQIPNGEPSILQSFNIC